VSQTIPLEPATRAVRGACPLDCPDTGSWIVTVQGGDAVALRGGPEHRFARGSLCNKVADYLQSNVRVTDPQRTRRWRVREQTGQHPQLRLAMTQG
jgi:hypothetical protein